MSAIDQNKKKQKRRRMMLRNRVKESVQKVRPAVFDEDAPKPLAVGIHDQLSVMLPDEPMYAIRGFLVWWCRREAYIRAIAADGSYRYHATGRRGKKVTDEHRAFAVETLAGIASEKESS